MRRPVDAMGGKATVFVVALGVGLTAAAVTLTPGRSQDVAAGQPTAVALGTTTLGQSAVAPPLDDPSADEIARLRVRIERRLDRRDHTSFVTLTLDNESLVIDWEVAPPRTSAEGSTADGSVDAHRRQLRRELRHILRSLATTALPPAVTTVHLRGVLPGARVTDVQEAVVVLDAEFDAKTLSALDGDVRLGDATLEELLGLADRASGDAEWGVPAGAPTAG